VRYNYVSPYGHKNEGKSMLWCLKQENKRAGKTK
jgi:hypothetical protein